MRAWPWALAGLALAAPASAQNCRFAVDSVGREGTISETPTGTNYFAGGGVLFSCVGTRIRMSSDSVASYGGSIGVVQFIGRVRYEDTTVVMTSNTGTYFRNGERWEARGDVITTNLESGSTLRGPSLDYYRVLNGTRDTAMMYAINRPRINYFPVDSAGNREEAYIIDADRVRMRGNDQVWAGGRVVINRSDFVATSDSLRLDTGVRDDATLLGDPILRGLGRDSFTLKGKRVDLSLDNKELSYVLSQGRANAITADLDLKADTIGLDLENRKLVQTLAWGDSLRPHAVSADFEIRADSLAFDTPGQQLTESRAFGRASVAGTRDSTTGEQDAIFGDSVVARFVQRDSAGQSKTLLDSLVARGSARMYYRTGTDRSGLPGINYSRADRITVTMKPTFKSEVQRVELYGNVDGIQLDPRPVRPDSTPPDSARAGNGRP